MKNEMTALREQFEAMITNSGESWEYANTLKVVPYDDVLDLMQKAYDIPRWVDCSERLPEESGYYMTYISGFSRPLELYYSIDYGYFATTDRSRVNITHWQPLPEKPTTQK